MLEVRGSYIEEERGILERRDRIEEKRERGEGGRSVTIEESGYDTQGKGGLGS
jgi:hypothetical protein